jgi:hypothetical protein
MEERLKEQAGQPLVPVEKGPVDHVILQGPAILDKLDGAPPSWRCGARREEGCQWTKRPSSNA